MTTDSTVRLLSPTASAAHYTDVDTTSSLKIENLERSQKMTAGVGDEFSIESGSRWFAPRYLCETSTHSQYVRRGTEQSTAHR